MCGIVAVFDEATTAAQSLSRRLMSRIQHRGTQRSQYLSWDGGVLGYRRLPIVDKAAPGSPVKSEDGRWALALNGEIYNARDLATSLPPTVRFKTQTDSEVLLRLWEAHGLECLDQLDGMFAFVVIDRTTGDFYAARDCFGIKPLYYAASGSVYVIASEAKAIPADLMHELRYVPPGHVLTRDGLTRWYDLPQPTARDQPTAQQAADRVRKLLEAAVAKRIPPDHYPACFLSGGVDSSAITVLVGNTQDVGAIMASMSGIRRDSKYVELLHASKHCADGVRLQTAGFTEHDIEKNLERVIYHLERFDEVTVSDAVGTWFAAKLAHQEGHRVVLSGDGSDEIFGGYDTIKDVPPNEVIVKIRNYVETLHQFDVLRLDRISMAFGLEVRVPFLDRALVEYVLGLPGELLARSAEAFGPDKHLLRHAMRDSLPNEILQRPKESMLISTGVLPALRHLGEQEVSDSEYEGEEAQAYCESYKIGSKLEYFLFQLWRHAYRAITPEVYARAFGHGRHRYY